MVWRIRAKKEGFKPGVKEWGSYGWWGWWVHRRGNHWNRWELESWRLVQGWQVEAGSWFQRWGEACWKHYLYLPEMMLVDDPVWPEMKSKYYEEAKWWWDFADMQIHFRCLVCVIFDLLAYIYCWHWVKSHNFASIYLKMPSPSCWGVACLALFMLYVLLLSLHSLCLL